MIGWQSYNSSRQLNTTKSICSEVVKQTKSPKSDDFAQNLVSNELFTSTVHLLIVRNHRLMRRGKTRLSILILYFFIPFSRVEQKINTKFVDEQKINAKNITGETPQPEITETTTSREINTKNTHGSLKPIPN
jgi:hypothetical protein